jgi:hypothetical protein
MDLHEMLGGGPPSGTEEVVLYLPSCDRDGNDIDQEIWRDEALKVFAYLFRGATAYPPGKGVWRDDERGGELLFDDTVLVTSFAQAALLENTEVIRALRRFLHHLGREARQGEVGIIINGEYIGITDFDEDA